MEGTGGGIRLIARYCDSDNCERANPGGSALYGRLNSRRRLYLFIDRTLVLRIYIAVSPGENEREYQQGEDHGAKDTPNHDPGQRS